MTDVTLPRERLWIGLMTGTSMDGVDAALVRLPHDDEPGRIELIATHFIAMTDDLRGRLALVDGDTPVRVVTALDAELATVYAMAVAALLGNAGIAREKIAAIGCHGQTVWHAPDQDPPVTLQLGDPNRLAELSGITVVADFRRRDMAAGGQGAPLAPAFHHAFFSDPQEHRAAINIGGISNLTVLPQGRSPAITGFDTGPGNVLMDGWIQRHQGARYDADGAWAASGRVLQDLLQDLLSHPYFSQPPPKSTGRETFNMYWLDTVLTRHTGSEPADIQATLLALTTESIAMAVREHAPDCRQLLLCGGGAANDRLRQVLATALPGVTIQASDAVGMPADWVEAAGFAWLARETMAGRCSNVPAVTGARRAVVLGGVWIHQGRCNVQ